MVGSNYPPGMSKRDFVRAGIDQPHDHEHEFESDPVDWPILEDNAAIFHEYCMYSEGRWGEGWSCEESRTTRCELRSISLVREGRPDIEYLAETEDARNQFRHIESVFETVLMSLEHNDPSETNILDLDEPGYGGGFVRVQHGDYIVAYEER